MSPCGCYKQGIGNHCLRDVHHVSHYITHNRTGFLIYIPTRHLKVHLSGDTCEGACAAEKHNKFERQPVCRPFCHPQRDSIFFVVRPNWLDVLLRTSCIPLTIVSETLCPSITVKNRVVGQYGRRVFVDPPPETQGEPLISPSTPRTSVRGVYDTWSGHRSYY